MRSVNIRYLAAVDHLRAVAATLILLYHGLQMFMAYLRHPADPQPREWLSAYDPFTALVIEGHTAVALFMILSGYIFTRGALGRKVHHWGFIKNRLLRTYPLFLTFLLTGCLMKPGAVTWQSLAYTVFGMANWVQKALYVPPWSSMFWTIAVEWQFYLVFPFLLLLFNGRRWGIIAAIVVAATCVRWYVFHDTDDARDVSYWTIFGRIDQFLIGMGTALAAQKDRVSRVRAWMLGVTLVALSSFWAFNALGGWPVTSLYKIFWPTIEGAVWGAFVFVYVQFAPLIKQSISKLLCLLGTVSYSFYLWQWVVVDTLVSRGWVFRYVPNTQQSAIIQSVLVAFPITLLLSTITYNLIERPFLGFRTRYLVDPAKSAA